MISWETTNWNLTTPWNSSEMEMLDMEKDVCADVGKETGLFMVPHKLNWEESQHVCNKLSGIFHLSEK